MSRKVSPNSCICPIIASNFDFKPLKLLNGIYLIDLKRYSFWESVEKTLWGQNVGILFEWDEVEIISKPGVLDLEHATDLVFLYLFVKTRKSYKVNKNFNTHVIHKDDDIEFDYYSRPYDPFDKYGFAYISYYNYTFGNDRRNLFDKRAYNRIKKSLRHINEYEVLIDAQLPEKSKSPLGVSVNTFMAGFANDMWDDPKLILATSSLEALFLNTTSEIIFRLSHNIAWFLYPKEKDATNRRKVIDNVKAIYSHRSKIVHGTYTEVLNEMWDSSLELLISVYTKIIEVYKVPNYFLNKELHDILLKNLEVGVLDLDIQKIS